MKIFSIVFVIITLISYRSWAHEEGAVENIHEMPGASIVRVGNSWEIGSVCAPDVNGIRRLVDYIRFNGQVTTVQPHETDGHELLGVIVTAENTQAAIEMQN